MRFTEQLRALARGASTYRRALARGTGRTVRALARGTSTYRRLAVAALLAAAGLGAAALPAYALPSYARQTGFSCAACHTIYPELTPLGRRFKLTGYVLTTTPTQGTAQEEYVLNRTPPISAMVMISATQTQKDVPDSNPTTLPGAKAQNNTVEFPQQLSLFYAGRISPNTGTFMQFTYSGPNDKFSIDNTDIRIVDQGAIGSAQFVYGLTLNNNPTVQDLWNSTPAWGFRYASSVAAPTPGAAIQIDNGPMAAKVAGLGGYAAWLRGSSFVYGELSFYRSFQPGAAQPLDSTASSPVLQDTAPYLRVAYEANWATTSLEIGALGMSGSLLPTNMPALNPDGTPVTTAAGTPLNKGLNQVAANRFSDSGIDGQLQYIPSDKTILTASAIWLHEDINLGADTFALNSAAAAVAGTSTLVHASNSLDTMRLTGSYYHNRTEGIIAQWFSTTGSKDGGLYAANRINAPDSSGYIVELVYNPYLNVRYSLQYTMYDKFDGAATNYDGSGRSASDNDTVYLLAWLMF